MMLMLELGFRFFCCGLFAIGGGLATLPFLYNISKETGWYTFSDISNMIAVSESTPGPIGINMATYVGYTIGGIPGALVATFGIILPGIILVIIVTSILDKFRNNLYVEGAFYGLRPASTALITSAGLLVAKITFLNLDIYKASGAIADLLNYKAVIFAVILLIFTRWVKQTKDLHPAIFIGISAVVGIMFSFGAA